MKLTSILIIDDDESDRYLLKRMLKRKKLVDVVYEVGDGKHALELFTDLGARERAYPDWQTPDIVFLDINMPLMGGFEFLEAFERLRERPEYQSVTFVMLSSSGRPEDRERALDYDFVTDYVVKQPSSPVEICEMLSPTGDLD